MATKPPKKNIYELSDEMKDIVGKPQFTKSVMYTYNKKHLPFLYLHWWT